MTYAHHQTGHLVSFPPPGDDGSSVTVHDRFGAHIADFDRPCIGGVASTLAPRFYHSSSAASAIAAVEAALVERYAATLDSVWLSARIRTAAGLV